MVSIIQLLALLFSLNGPETSAYMEIELQPESRIWIEGRSNVGQFTCHATEKEGYALIAMKVEGTASTSDDEGSAEMRIPVECFDCGNDRMDRDLFHALKGADHREIRFELVEVTAKDNGNASVKRMEGIGELTIAGTTRQIAFTAEGTTLSNDRMRATGKVMIRMTDFAIEPPTGLMGLVKAQDGLTVNFDLVAKPVRSLRSNQRR